MVCKVTTWSKEVSFLGKQTDNLITYYIFKIICSRTETLFLLYVTVK